MKWKLLDLLACPGCKGDLHCKTDIVHDEEIIEGLLTCQTCTISYPIKNAIPRFVALDNYSASFGMQWNLYKYTQVDTYSGLTKSRDRLFSETGWDFNNLQNEWILDAGCGNGRFLDIATRSNADVVGVDLSNAIDAAKELFKDRRNIHLVQASILNLPFKNGVFDKAYCIGVAQHTPDPEQVVTELPRILKRGGDIAVTIYEKRLFTLLNSKYLLRPLTKHCNKKFLLFLIKCLAPILFPITEVLYRLPLLGKVFKFVIPFANYVNDDQLTLRQRYEWAILDTFDMLSPAFDLPQTEPVIAKILGKAGIIKINRLANPGLNLVGVKSGS